jgi:hypothetical protein
VKQSLKELQTLYDPAREAELDQPNITQPGSFGGQPASHQESIRACQEAEGLDEQEQEQGFKIKPMMVTDSVEETPCFQAEKEISGFNNSPEGSVCESPVKGGKQESPIISPTKLYKTAILKQTQVID